MEGELWIEVRRIVQAVGVDFQRKRVRYTDAGIVEVYLWSVWHDRPVCWASEAANWPDGQRPARLPVPSTMSVRLRTESVRSLLAAVEARLRKPMGTSWCKWIDGLPLPVGGATHDPDARPGRGARGMAIGYKLHAICDARGGLDAWEISPLNVNEKVVARVLLARLNGEGYVVGDGQYDSNGLYGVAATQGFQLVAPVKRGRALGHRRYNGWRLRCRDLNHRRFGQALLHQRYEIDRFFAHMGNFGGGLSPLPHWVRRLHRVRLWLHGKIILNAARIALARDAA